MTKSKITRQITTAFRRQGRSNCAVFEALSRKAMREIQQAKIRSLIGKNWMPKAIADEIVRIHGSLVYTEKTIAYYRQKYLRKRRGNAVKTRGRPRRNDVQVKIIRLRQEGTRVSIRRTAKLLKEPRMTVYRNMKALGGELDQVKMNPHVLTTAQKAVRIRLAGDLLLLLRDKKKWPRIITGDESWIYLNNFGKSEWLLPGEEPTIGSKKNIGDKKLLLIVFFSTSGIHYSEFLPEGEKVNPQVMCSVLSSISGVLKTDATHPIWVHMDNARPHRAKTTQNKRLELHIQEAPHPPYSPDLAPSDFYLFGYLKGAISGSCFSCFEEMQQRVTDEITNISPKILRSVFNNWIRRLENCISNGGEYVTDNT